MSLLNPRPPFTKHSSGGDLCSVVDADGAEFTSNVSHATANAILAALEKAHPEPWSVLEGGQSVVNAPAVASADGDWALLIAFKYNTAQGWSPIMAARILARHLSDTGFTFNL